MFRPLILVFAGALIATACSESTAEEDRAAYFRSAAALSTTYEAAAGALFDSYLGSLESATAETGDAIFVGASKSLFAGLASEFDAAVTGLSDLEPPDDVEAVHAEWLAAAAALSAAFQGADRDLSSLTDAPAVDSVLSVLPVPELQGAYRTACSAVASLASTEAGSAITCQPAQGG